MDAHHRERLKGSTWGEGRGCRRPLGNGGKRVFVMRNNWFAFSQTEPDERGDCPSYTAPETPIYGWDKSQALKALEVTDVPFEQVNGNKQGYARPLSKEVSVSPLAKLPHKTLFHELAHCILHAKEAELACLFELDKSICEAEAEATAFLCCAALGLPGLEQARGYVQAWLGSGSTREAFKKSASRVFTAANRILKAGACERVDEPVKATTTEFSIALDGQGMLFA